MSFLGSPRHQQWFCFHELTAHQGRGSTLACGGTSGNIAPRSLELIASLLTIGGLVLWFGRPAFSWFRRSIWIPFREARTGIPKRTLIVQEGDRRATFWGDAQRGSEAMTRAHIALHLTNVAKRRVRATKVELHFRQGSFRTIVRNGRPLHQTP